MKHILSAFLLVILSLAMAFKGYAAEGLMFGVTAGAATFFLLGHAMTPWSAMNSNLCVTLTATQILALSIQAFKKRVPVLALMGTDFTGMNLIKGQAAIARIPTLPSVSSYDVTQGGYKNGAALAKSLWTDVPLTIENWSTVPLRIKHEDLITDATKLDFNSNVAHGGYVLGKKIVDDTLALVGTKRFSQDTVIGTNEFDVDALITIGAAMNGKTESTERYLLVNTAVASVLAADQRLINSQWFGTAQGGEPIRVWRNAFGFREIREYPDLPVNNGTALTGVSVANSGDLFTKASHGLVTGQRVNATGFSAGFTAGYYYAIYVSANTFQLADTRALALAGTATAASADGTGGTVTPTENMSAFAFESRAFAIKAGAPPAMTAEVAGMLGVPQNTVIESMFDQETQIAMGMAKWQEPGTADLYVVPTVLWGAKVGGDITSTSGAIAGAGLDYAGHVIHSA
jgi:hypothetical protein